MKKNINSRDQKDEKIGEILDILQRNLKEDHWKKLIIPQETDEFTELYIMLNSVIDRINEHVKKHESMDWELKITKEFYEQVLSAIDNGVFISDKDDMISYSNNGMAEISGIKIQDIQGKIVLRDFPKKMLKSFRPHYLNAKKSKMTVYYDTIPIDYSPTHRVYQSGWLIPILKDGKYDGMICTAEDVTNRKIAQDARSESEGKLDKIFKANPDITFVTDVKGNILRANPSLLNLFGLSLKQIKKKNAMDLFVGTEGENFKQIIDKLKKGEEIRGFEVKGKSATGEKRTIEINAIPLQEENTIDSFLFAARDITEHKKAAYELQSTKQRFKNVFDSAVVSLWEEDYSDVFSLIEDLKAQGVTDFRKYINDNPYFVSQVAQNVKITDANEETLRLFGAKSKEEMLKSLSMYFLPETQKKFKDQILAMVEGKDRLTTPYIMKNINGDKMHVLRALVLPTNSSQSKRSIVSFKNMTEKKIT